MQKKLSEDAGDLLFDSCSLGLRLLLTSFHGFRSSMLLMIGEELLGQEINADGLVLSPLSSEQNFRIMAKHGSKLGILRVGFYFRRRYVIIQLVRKSTIW